MGEIGTTAIVVGALAIGAMLYFDNKKSDFDDVKTRQDAITERAIARQEIRTDFWERLFGNGDSHEGTLVPVAPVSGESTTVLESGELFTVDIEINDQSEQIQAAIDSGLPYSITEDGITTNFPGKGTKSLKSGKTGESEATWSPTVGTRAGTSSKSLKKGKEDPFSGLVVGKSGNLVRA